MSKPSTPFAPRRTGGLAADCALEPALTAMMTTHAAQFTVTGFRPLAAKEHQTMARPHILVLAGDDARAAVAAAGFAVAGEDGARRQTAAVLVDVRGAQGLKAGQVVRSLKAALGPRAGVFFAWADDNSAYDCDEFDGALPCDATPALIGARLGFALRVAVMADEARLRFQTLAAFGGAAAPPGIVNERPPAVLMFGPPGPDVLAFTAALEILGAETVASLSSFTAFDYLHSGGFDAVVVVARDDRAGALGFCAAVRRNARLFHLPCLILASPDFHEPEDTVRRGATDWTIAGDDDAAAALRLLGHVDEKRRRDALALAFSAARAPAAMDPGTGLYGKAFFLAHLEALARRARETDRPLSVIAVRVAGNPALAQLSSDHALDRIVGQAGAMLGRLVRAEDVAARLDRATFAVAFPASDADAARVAGERIAAVLECGAFDAGDASQAVSFKLDVASATFHPDDNAEALLAAAVAALPEPWL